MSVCRSVRFLAAICLLGLFVSSGMGQSPAVSPATVSPAKDKLAVAVAPVAPEQIVRKTIDLNEAVNGYAQSRGVSLDVAWKEARESCGLANVTRSADRSGRDFAPLRQVEIRPGVFQIQAGESYFEALHWNLESLRCGNRQIVMEVRIMRVSEELLSEINKTLPGGWSTGKPGANANAPLLPQPSNASPFKMAAAKKKSRPTAAFVSAVTKTERATPCRLAKLDKPATDRLVAAIQNDTRSNILQAPKVTVFPGQHAVVADSTQRPFVTGIDPLTKNGITANQPVIEVMEEGLKVDLTLDLAGEQIDLDSVIEFSKIGEVDTFTFVPEGTSEEATIQIPERSVKKVELSQRIGSGVSLLIAPHFYTERVEKKGFPRREVKTREFPLLLLTPTVISE